MHIKGKTKKHPVQGNGCRLEGKIPTLDGTASPEVRRLQEHLEEAEENQRLHADGSWCIDHGEDLPPRWEPPHNPDEDY